MRSRGCKNDSRTGRYRGTPCPGHDEGLQKPAGGYDSDAFISACGNEDQQLVAHWLIRAVRTRLTGPVRASGTRLNAFVVSGFAGIALLIAVVGVSGVLAFSVSTRTREFGVRLAVGSSPRHLLLRILSEGASIVAAGIAAGAACGYLFAGVAASYIENVHFPGAVPVLAAAIVLAVAAVVASVMPAARAARVDVLQALRSE